MFVYESVPGTAVHGFKADENDVTFVVEGPENASITLELEPETEYKVQMMYMSARTRPTSVAR